ncbi:MAG: hypothetical protein AAGI23_10860 [Bacteroidota bacterium]
MGSSRGARNVIAQQLEDSLNQSSYNLSYPGSNIEFHKFLLEALLEFNQPPEKILLVVDDKAELLPSSSIKFRYDRMYPLLKYDFVIDEMIDRGEKSTLAKFFILSRISLSNFDLRKKSFGRLDTIQAAGSMPIAFQKSGIDWQYGKNTSYNIQEEVPEKLSAFKAFQDQCLSASVELVLIFPPNFGDLNPKFKERILQLKKDQVSTFFYDADNPIYQDSAAFYDRAHLRTKSASIFTEEIVDYLKVQ